MVSWWAAGEVLIPQKATTITIPMNNRDILFIEPPPFDRPWLNFSSQTLMIGIMIQAVDLCCNPLERRCTRGNGFTLPLATRFHALPAGLLLTLFATISLMIVMGYLAASLGLRRYPRYSTRVSNILTQYMPFVNGDSDRRGVVRGSGAFSDERYIIAYSRYN